MKVRTASQYKARFNRRGKKPLGLTVLKKNIIHRVYQIEWMVDYGSYKQKPQHELRFHNIADCFPRSKQAT